MDLHLQWEVVRTPIVMILHVFRANRASTKAVERIEFGAGQRIATWSSQHGWSGDSRPEVEWHH